MNQEISDKKDVITALNILHLTNWPHLCGSDAWTVVFNLTVTHRGFRNVMMVQASKRSPNWSTSGRLRWGEGEWVYKGNDSLTKKRIWSKKEKERKRRTL